jgi:predicted DNA-binding transcriptional regulator AlpA
VPHVAPPAAALLLTAEDLARLLQLSGKTIKRMDQAGRLPRAVRLGERGHTKRWRRDEIDAWIAAGCPDRGKWETTSEFRARFRRAAPPPSPRPA